MITNYCLKEIIMTLTMKTSYPSLLGFDRLFDHMDHVFHNFDASYPFYNVIKESNDTDYTLELATAGFLKSELDISIKEGVLTIKGEKKDKPDVKYLHKGIGTRKFTKAFGLVDTMEVLDTEYNDGILTIKLHNNLPKEKQAKKISIK